MIFTIYSIVYRGFFNLTYNFTIRIACLSNKKANSLDTRNHDLKKLLVQVVNPSPIPEVTMETYYQFKLI